MSTTRVGWFVRLLILAFAFLLGPGVANDALGQCGTLGNSCMIDEECDDGLSCNGDELCVGGFCECGTPPECTTDSQCNDRLSCNGVEVCVNGFCECGMPPSCTSDDDCNDGIFCNGQEFCDEGICACGPVPNCNDEYTCTFNQCGSIPNVVSDGCFTIPIHAECDDFLWCTGVESCDPSHPDAGPVTGCVAGTPPCDDGIACTFNPCNEQTQTCGAPEPDDSVCDDGVFCNGMELCDPEHIDADADGCVAGAYPCAEHEICDEAAGMCRGCVTAAECGGTFCAPRFCDPVAGGGDGCVAGDSPCNDFLACTIDQCDEIEECTNTPDHDFCDDGNECTECFCDPTDSEADDDGCVCIPVADQTLCADDGFTCTADVCIAGVCTHQPVDEVCEDGNECTDCVCDSEDSTADTEGCVCTAADDAEERPCTDDGIDCTDDICVNGVCSHVPDDSACDDFVDCTDDVCDPSTGCVNTPNDANCPGGSFCDGFDVCDPVNDCQPGTPPVCPSETPHCDPATDQCVECLNDDHCDDGLACNGLETCVIGVCRVGTAIVCDDGIACTVGQCTEPSGECEQVPNHDHCDDGNVCSGVELCDPEDDLADVDGCVAGTPLVCDDGWDCTDKDCDPVVGCFFTPNDANCTSEDRPYCDPASGFCAQCLTNAHCDDGDVCTGEEVCNENVCSIITAPLVCDDGVFCNGVETCDPVVGCQDGTPPECPEETPFCDPELDHCVECLTDADCDDELACNGIERCVYLKIADTRVCQSGEPVVCDDGIDCTIDECIEPTGECRFTPDDSYCDDGDFCNGAEWCNPNVTVAGGSVDGCEAGEPPVCDDFNACTLNYCAENACQSDPISDCIQPLERRASISNKGSLLMLSKIEIKWDDTGRVLQDTFVSLTNDYPGGVYLQAYFINGDAPIEEIRSNVPPFNVIREAEPGWNKIGCRFFLTSNQPRSWSAVRGGMGCPAFTWLDPVGPGRPDPETNGQTRVLRGYVVMWAQAFNGSDRQWQEIRWNHLDASATVVNYAEATAWDYQAWKFRAHGVQHGQFTGTAGVLNLDGVEYDFAFSHLLLDFYGSNTMALSAPGSTTYLVDTDLTLHPVSVDLRQDNNGPLITKAQFEVWNEFEAKFSGTRRCIQCWDETLLSAYSTSVSIPNHFVRSTLGTDKGTARIEGVASVECDNRPPFFRQSEAAALLGVAAKYVAYEGSNRRSMAGINLIGLGTWPTVIRYNPQSGPLEFTTGDEFERDLWNPRAPRAGASKKSKPNVPARDPILRDVYIPEE